MDFWDVFWLLLIFIPLLIIWALAVVDIFRREDLSGSQQALWVVLVVLLPFIGTLIYLIFRPQVATPDERSLELLADLHQRGKLSDADYTEEKARLLGTKRS